MVLSLFLLLLCVAAASATLVDLTGNIEVTILETPGHESLRHYHFTDISSRKNYLLTFAPTIPTSSLASGSRYHIVGELKELNRTIDVVSISPADSLRSQHSSKKQRWTDANRTIVIVLVQFVNSTYQPTPNASSVTELFWTGSSNVAAFFTWVSQGNINFVEDMNGDGQPDIYSVTITDPTICWDIPALAQTAAEASYSVDIMNWEHHVFVLPPDYANCGAGVANIGCTQGNCNAYAAAMRGDVFTHELGHTLGLDHSNSLALQGLSPIPVWTEYMDYSSSMSLSLDLMRRGYNAVDLYNLDVLPPSTVTVLSTPVATTSYALQDLHATSGTRVIRFTELGILFHVSYRQGTNGYDSDLSNNLYQSVYTGAWNNEVFIHYPDTVHAPLMSFLSGVEKPGDGIVWTSPGCQWAVEFVSSSNGVASVSIGSPSQLGASCVQGTTIPPPMSTTTEEIYVYLTSHAEIVPSTIPPIGATAAPTTTSTTITTTSTAKPTTTVAPVIPSKTTTAASLPSADPVEVTSPTTHPTTQATTTARPTTVPSTAAPTTTHPTTQAATTARPTTVPSTAAPTTTARPTTHPTTQATTTARPTTVPSTAAPTTTARPTTVPSTAAPTTTARPSTVPSTAASTTTARPTTHPTTQATTTARPITAAPTTTPASSGGSGGSSGHFRKRF